MTKQTLDSMAEMPESAAGSSRRNRRGSASGASNVTAGRGNGDPSEQRMLEEVVERQNMRAAYQQVKRNAGARTLVERWSVAHERGAAEALLC